MPIDIQKKISIIKNMQKIFSIKSTIYFLLYYFRIFRYESQYYMLKNFRNTEQQEMEKEGDSSLEEKEMDKKRMS